MKTNNEIDDMIKSYICESPDNGDTVYCREMGSSDKELISDDIMISSNSSEYYLLDDTLDTIDLSNLGSLTVGGNGNTTPSDITIRVDGRDRNVSELFDAMNTIEKRLGILRPDPKLLGKYELLQSLYEQYKAAEAMLYEDNEEEEFSF